MTDTCPCCGEKMVEKTYYACPRTTTSVAFTMTCGTGATT